MKNNQRDWISLSARNGLRLTRTRRPSSTSFQESPSSPNYSERAFQMPEVDAARRRRYESLPSIGSPNMYERYGFLAGGPPTHCGIREDRFKMTETNVSSQKLGLAVGSSTAFGWPISTSRDEPRWDRTGRLVIAPSSDSQIQPLIDAGAAPIAG